MRILLSNDDGVHAPGLAALHGAVVGMGEVTVVAPAEPQNAVSQSITLREPLTVRRVDVAGPPAFEALAVAGRPADCVRLALRKLLTEMPDVVIAGINAGVNAGVNVLYSGTVAAAAEAALLNIPAVAFSAGMPGEETDFVHDARLCAWVLRRLLADGLRGGDLVNVNIPTLGPNRPRGVRVLPQSTARLEDKYLDASGDGTEAYRLSHEYSFARQENTDVAGLADGYITITPLHIDRTHPGRLRSLADLAWDDMPEGGW